MFQVRWDTRGDKIIVFSCWIHRCIFNAVVYTNQQVGGVEKSYQKQIVIDVCVCVYNKFLLLLCKEKKNENGSVDG